MTNHGTAKTHDMLTSKGVIPSEPFVDSKEKVYKAMLESLESFVRLVHYPQTRDEDELRGEIKQMEWVVERAHRLEEAEHE